MSLRHRMAAIVGDENSVGRYLLEKVGHTALIAWALVCVVGLSLAIAATAATLLYVVTGKLLWHRSHPDASWNLRDLAFDTLVSALVLVLAAYARHGVVHGLLAAGIWAVLFAAGSNNRWGSPS